MLSIEPSYPSRTDPEYSSTAEAQEKDLKTNYLEMIEVLKKKMNKSLNKIQGKANKNFAENEKNPLRSQEDTKEHFKEMDKMAQDLKIKKINK